MRVLCDGVAIPSADETELVQHEAELPSHNPSVVAFAFLADLPFASAFSDGVDELDSIAISHPQDSWLSQEAICPCRMSFQESEKPCSFREIWEEMGVISQEPPIKCSLAYSFDGKQQANGDYLARIKLALRMLGDISHLIIYPAEEMYDKIFCREHGDSSL